jgi:hypothetical protein
MPNKKPRRRGSFYEIDSGGVLLFRHFPASKYDIKGMKRPRLALRMREKSGGKDTLFLDHISAKVNLVD